jgi:ATP-dependent Clp protease adaptor protein ClpS
MSINQQQRPDGETLEKTRPEVRQPELYQVILLNDDYTTMDFVVEVLETVFFKRPAEAHRIMLLVHTQGRGVCGIYPYEIAETKVEAVESLARQHDFPLQATLEPE